MIIMNDNTFIGSLKQQSHVAQFLLFAYSIAAFTPPNARVLGIGVGFNSIAEFCYNAEIYLQKYHLAQEFTGIDIDDRHLSIIREGLAQNEIPVEQYRFIHADAQRLETITTGQFGLTIVRHPQVEENHSDAKHHELYDVWMNIFEKAKQKVSNNGLLIATHFRQQGFLYTKEILQEQGYDLKFSGENPFKGSYFRSENNEPCHFDKYLIVARK